MQVPFVGGRPSYLRRAWLFSPQFNESSIGRDLAYELLHRRRRAASPLRRSASLNLNWYLHVGCCVVQSAPRILSRSHLSPGSSAPDAYFEYSTELALQPSPPQVTPCGSNLLNNLIANLVLAAAGLHRAGPRSTIDFQRDGAEDQSLQSPVEPRIRFVRVQPDASKLSIGDAQGSVRHFHAKLA